MTDVWTPDRAAQDLLDTLPALGRIMAHRLREDGEEMATMMQAGVLMRLREAPCTTSDLAKHRKVSLQSASVFVQGMVDRGGVGREADRNDRRRMLLKVTPEGESYAQTAHARMTSLLAELMGGLHPDELQAAGIFLSAVRRLVAAQLQSADGSEL